MAEQDTKHQTSAPAAAQLDARSQKFVSDFKFKSLPMQIGVADATTTWPRVVAYPDTWIPFTQQGFVGHPKADKDGKGIVVNFTVLDCLAPGFTRVPYWNENGKTKTGPDAKPLSEVDVEYMASVQGDTDLTVIRCHTFETIEGMPKEKGPRVELEEFKWRIVPGMSFRITMWADAARGGPDPSKFKAALCPAGHDMVQAFTPLELEIAIKGWDQYNIGDEKLYPRKIIIEQKNLCMPKKHYGIGLNGLKLTNGSLYSLAGLISKVLKNSSGEASKHLKELSMANTCISQIIQDRAVPYRVSNLAVDTFFDYDEANALVKVTEFTDDPIDIDVKTLLAMTNCASVEDACSLLQLSCAAGALSIVAHFDQYRRKLKDEDPVYSTQFGAPLIDTDKLLATVGGVREGQTSLEEFDDKFYSFPAGFTIKDDDEAVFEPVILVSKVPLTDFQCVSPVVDKIPCPDMVLVGVGLPMTGKAYFVRFMDPRNGRSIWNGYVRNLHRPGKMFGTNTEAIFGEGGRLQVPPRRRFLARPQHPNRRPPKPPQRKRLWTAKTEDFDPFSPPSLGAGASQADQVPAGYEDVCLPTSDDGDGMGSKRGAGGKRGKKGHGE